MANNTNWEVAALECIPDVNGLLDYVCTIHWRCSGDDGNNHTGLCYSTVSFEANPDHENFIPFAQLTEMQVLQWVFDKLGAEGVLAVEASVDSQIEAQVNPPIVTPPLPWVAGL